MKLLSILSKLVLSVVAAYLFILIGSYLPHFKPKSSTQQPGEPLSPIATLQASGQLPSSTLSIAGMDNRLMATMFAPGQDAGFAFAELATDGPCEEAGRRLVQAKCADCQLIDTIDDDTGVSTITWVSPAGGTGVTFADCSETRKDGSVVVPQLTISGDRLSIDNDTVGKVASIIPAPKGSERASSITLGPWAVAVDSIKTPRAIDDMEQRLLQKGWTKVAPPEDPEGTDQRMFSNGPDKLCIVTLDKTGDGYQLVTMMTI